MTKAEVIRRVTKRAGVPDTEAKLFFEMFLKKASFRLKPGDSLTLENVGHFQLRKGRLKYSGEDSSAVSEFLVYSPLLRYDNSESIIFNIPVYKEEDYYPVDLFFSLSFGKPVIPLKGVKPNEFFIPPSVNEQRRLFEAKIERLLSNSEIVEDQDIGNNILILDSELYNSQPPAIQEVSVSDETKKIEAEVKEALSSKDYEEVPWDFGEDISRQIEEDSILDFDKDDISSYDQFPRVSSKRPAAEGTKSLKDKEPYDEEITPQQSKKDFEEVDRIGNFERVKSITREILPSPGSSSIGLTKSEMDLSWDFGSSSEIDKDEIEKNISEISQSLYNTAVAGDSIEDQITGREQEHNELQEPELSELQEENHEEYIRPELRTAEIESSFYDEQETGTNEETITGSESTSTQPPYDEQYGFLEQEYKKRKSNAGFIITVGVLAIIGASILIYYQSGLKLSSFFQKEPEVKESIVSSPEKIDRDYQVPVNYPYDKNNPVEKRNPIDSSVYKSRNVLTQKSNNSGNNAAQELTGGTKVKEFIYKYPEGYFVQISSWKSKRRAEDHAERFRINGYQSFIERASLSGDVFYRVKVGTFSSVNEAEDFQNKNQ